MRLIILTVATLAILAALGIHDETPEVREWDIAHQTLPDLKSLFLQTSIFLGQKT